MNTKYPDISDLENSDDLLPAIISDMASTKEGKTLLVNALKKNGVAVSESDNNEYIYTSIYTSLAASRTFRADLKRAIFTYLKQDDGKELNVGGDLSANLKKRLLTKTPPEKTKTPRERKPFKETGVGKFFSSIVTTENAEALTNFAVNIVSGRLQDKANRQALNEGVEYQVARTQALETETKTQEAKAKWVVPVVVISGIVVVSVIGYLVYRNVKSKSK